MIIKTNSKLVDKNFITHIKIKFQNIKFWNYIVNI